LRSRAREEAAAIARRLETAGYPTIDLTGSELAKTHIRNMVGGRAAEGVNEIVFSFEFPERRGARVVGLSDLLPLTCNHSNVAAMPSPPIAILDDAVEKLQQLHVGVIGTAEERHERPHKLVLLLGALDLIASGQAKLDRMWSHARRSPFAEYFSVVQSLNDQNTTENPFRRFQTDEVWFAIEMLDGRTCTTQP